VCEDAAARVERRDGGSRHDRPVLVPQGADNQLVGAGGRSRYGGRAQEADREGDLQEAFTSLV
jgi:hypothetical protein